jgi:hypothetical protein
MSAKKVKERKENTADEPNGSFTREADFALS